MPSGGHATIPAVLGPLSRLRATRRRTATFGFVALALLGIATLSACGSSSSLPSGVVAQVGDTQITQAQLDTYMSQLSASATAQGQAFPTPGTSSYQTAQQDALQQLIQLQIVGFEAGKCGKPCAVSDAEISTQLDTLAKQRFGGSQVKLVAYLRSLDFTLNQARDQVKAGLQQQKLQTYVERGVTFTPAQAEAYYVAHAAQYNVPETRTVSHILVASDALAKTIRAEVTPTNFAVLARKYSTDTGSKIARRRARSHHGLRGRRAVRQGRVRPEGRPDLPARALPVRLAHHLRHQGHAAAPHHRGGRAPRIISSQLAAARTAAYQAWVTKTLAYWNAQTKYASSSLAPATSSSGVTTTG